MAEISPKELAQRRERVKATLDEVACLIKALDREEAYILGRVNDIVETLPLNGIPVIVKLFYPHDDSRAEVLYENVVIVRDPPGFEATDIISISRRESWFRNRVTKQELRVRNGLNFKLLISEEHLPEEHAAHQPDAVLARQLGQTGVSPAMLLDSSLLPVGKNWPWEGMRPDRHL